MANRYRVIVVGCGAIGAATAYWLSRRLGGEVLVLEQFDLGHSRGASEDHSRVIRHTYTRTAYTTLTPAAYQSWNIVEQATGLRLVQRTGGLILASSQAPSISFVDDTVAAMAATNLPYEEVGAADVMRRWPQWRLEPHHRGVLDPEAGVLDIRQATAAHVALSRDNGVTIVPNAPVTGLTETAGGVEVAVADGRRFTADRLVLAGGAWNPALLELLGTRLPITLTEEQVTYFATPKVREFTPDRFPVFGFIDDDSRLYYGLPVYGEVAVKAGLDGVGPEVTSETRTYRADPGRVDEVRRFLGRHLPAAVGPELYSRVCCYDFPPDRDFIADFVPGHDRVLVCAGAGHAGKFAGLLGRVLTELALDGVSRFPVEAFRADRPALYSSAPMQVSRSNSM
ncbi:N-methyl-L-tryptophan oxidase [Jiangella muralis]|uniref:N-methyl-L-tryptophan oxidase n=1 Tax=Jiangella muralis TaxID=702383 RepID=UPI00069F74C6|nr:N-methyl-L-tryptophan oxidase [Jiangella muralis]